MNLRQFYTEEYPDDELGLEINSKATSIGLLNVLFTQEGNQVYEYLGVYDSVIRERVFELIAEELGMPCDYVYSLW